MKSINRILAIAGFLALAGASAFAASYTTTNYCEDGNCTFGGTADFTGTLKIGGTAVTASAAEINRLKLSTRIVSLAVDTTLTEATHEGKTLVLGGAGSARTMTLPAATGGGGIYKFIVGAVNTSNYVIQRAGSDTIKGGVVLMGDNASNGVTSFETTGASTITLNGTTKGGAAVGDVLILEDCAATVWCVRGTLTESGSEATPFS